MSQTACTASSETGKHGSNLLYPDLQKAQGIAHPIIGHFEFNIAQ